MTGGDPAALAAAVSLAAAAALAMPATAGPVPPCGSTAGAARPGGQGGRVPVEVRGLPWVAVAAVVTVGVLLGVPALLVPTGGLVTWAVSVLALRARRDRAALRTRAQVVDACEAMLGDLVAGQPPPAALRAGAQAWADLEPVSRAAGLGGDVPAALRLVSTVPGAGALTRLAAAWQLCSATGSGLADAVGQVLGTVRAEHEVVLAVRAELASARATARLLAVLPLVVLVMAQGVGADPWDFLLATVGGRLTLLAGAALAVAGVLWLEGIADRAQDGGV